MAVHGHNVVSVSLHEELLASNGILPDEYAASRVVDLVVFEEQVWVVERAEGKCSVEFEEGVGGKHSYYSV